jgi:hypothetical protein
MPHALDRNRLPWLILAIALMFGSAICGLLYMDAVGKISAWIGRPEYEGYIPRLRWHAGLWSGLAVSFPFLAALLLGRKGAGPHQAKTSRTLVITAPEVSHEWSVATTALAYLLRVAVSAVASLGFMVLFSPAIPINSWSRLPDNEIQIDVANRDYH